MERARLPSLHRSEPALAQTLPHPGVYTKVLTPAQTESVPLAPAPSGALARSASPRHGQRQGLAPLSAAHSSTDFALVLNSSDHKQTATVQMERMEVPGCMCS